MFRVDKNNVIQISIHALREEGDGRGMKTSFSCRGFLSTPSARRATKFKYPKQPDLEISIHALREEGDQEQAAMSAVTVQFLSTPSARRATPRAGVR